MNMNHGIYVTTIFLLICGVFTRVIEDISNSIEAEDEVTFYGAADEWVDIKRAPPAQIVKHSGNTLELECEAAGKPTPTVKWMNVDAKNGINKDFIDMNLINEIGSNSIGHVHSRLLINRNFPYAKSFKCFAQSGSKTAESITTVISETNNNITNLMEYNKIVVKKPRIVYYIQSLFQEQGSSVRLPCKASGHPMPKIYWLDGEDNVINNGDEPRYKFLSNGELLIFSLKWNDMGVFTCVAQNVFGKDKASTFIYPFTKQ